jgi:hypothetical protein
VVLDKAEPMTAEDVRRFIEGQTTVVLDPITSEVVAIVSYELDGTCSSRFPNGDTDTGRYGFDGDCYWTRYTRFRDGKRHSFFLVPMGVGRAQAYFFDGKRAFLQVQKEA